MTKTFDFEVLVSLSDSAAFARLSGDFNSLHLDPTAARRTQFGGTVVHGIHLFLRALDELADRKLFDQQQPAVLSASFNNPVSTSATVTLHVHADAKAIRLSALVDGRRVFSGSVELEPATNDELTIADSEFAPAGAKDVAFPPAATEGTVPLQVSSRLLRSLFPALATIKSTCWVADLLATTHIVGMCCPGMHSVYSGFRLLRFAPDIKLRSGVSMHYRVSDVDERFRLTQVSVTGARLTGTLEAFFRRRPVVQRSMSDVSTIVPSNAFVRHRALVIGGSRGLGEITAKILAAGGALVAITYARGKDDAERICTEIRQSARACTAYHMEIVSATLQHMPDWIRSSHFSHVYYFATPTIYKNSGRWNDSLFREYTRVYVSAFATLVERMLDTHQDHDTSVSFLYPSSIFVAQAESEFAEYTVAKTAGEALCDQLRTRYSARFMKPRLPRMRTDQTASLSDMELADPLPTMLDIVREFHS